MVSRTYPFTLATFDDGKVILHCSKTHRQATVHPQVSSETFRLCDTLDDDMQEVNRDLVTQEQGFGLMTWLVGDEDE